MTSSAAPPPPGELKGGIQVAIVSGLSGAGRSTYLYEFVWNLLAFAVIIWLDRRYRLAAGACSRSTSWATPSAAAGSR